MRSPEQKHTVQQGECLVSIAKVYGFEDAGEIYQHAKNADLRRLRPNPNLLYPGDTVVWNFYEHVRLGIEMLITKEFGKRAYDYLTGLHALSSTSRLDKAIFLRETVRGYNGGREFVHEGGQWKMSPWVGKHSPMPAARLPYVNKVLGTPRLTYPHVVAANQDIAALAGTMEPVL